MPFEHAATTAWGRWLRSISANRAPNQQIVGQDIEDSLRAVILAADVRNLTAPINWAQAGCRRNITGVAGDVSRVELNCLSVGGLWIDRLFIVNIFGASISIADAPALVGNQGGFADVGNIPVVATVGDGTITEAFPDPDEPVATAQSIPTDFARALYLPFGHTLRIRGQSVGTSLTLQELWWREIPAVQTP